ncbi:MAG: M20/M25/M40 family metallo-hydrolase [Planctomycetota bacterium]|jgi:acetylornithine deacetylase/succinyl-diaminopimelate desuccinylase-like protein|nr:M20/M25/M40 family metallo-hydrolase [Planctomycetota bacterium]
MSDVNDQALETAMAAVDAAFPALCAQLADLVRVPSCSFPGHDPQHLQAGAEATAACLRAAGFPAVELLDDGPWPPYVLATDHRAGPNAPCVLLYAHYDVQPIGRDELWTSPAYEPEERAGRLYGRGSADDKAGIAAIAGACSAWLHDGALPCNVTVWIEGEEEIGSPHLEAFLDAHIDKLRCDALVIADLGNVQTGAPTLTVSLRGMVSATIQARALAGPLHSGMWGGPAPDVVQLLCRALGSVSDAEGRLCVPGIAIPEPSAQALADLERVPYDAAAMAASMGVVPGGGDLSDGVRAYRRCWYEPVFSINAIHAGGAPGAAGNIINDCAWARVSVRIVSGMDPDATLTALAAHVRSQLPSWLQCEIAAEQSAEAWATTTDHPLFAICHAAFARGYGVEPVQVGCGGTIPFVGVLSERLGGVPALLVPVEDPDTRAHAENESVHLGDLRKTTRSLAAFLGMAGAVKKRGDRAQ